MYYEGRWERDFFEERVDTPPRKCEPIWLICLVMLLGPLIGAIVTVAIAIQLT
jgi:hypothetical protein